MLANNTKMGDDNSQKLLSVSALIMLHYSMALSKALKTQLLQLDWQMWSVLNRRQMFEINLQFVEYVIFK